MHLGDNLPALAIGGQKNGEQTIYEISTYDSEETSFRPTEDHRLGATLTEIELLLEQKLGEYCETATPYAAHTNTKNPRPKVDTRWSCANYGSRNT